MRTTNQKLAKFQLHETSRVFAQVEMVGSKCCDFKNREVNNVNAPYVSQVVHG